MSKYFLAILVLVVLSCTQHKSTEEIRAEHKARVEKNMYVGKVVNAIYLSDTTAMVKSNPSIGAVGGGAIAALLGFGAVGIIVGASIGADAEKPRMKYGKEEVLIIIAASGEDTSYFEIKVLDERVNLGKYSHPTKPTLMQIFLAVKPGATMRVPSSKPLSMYAKIYSNYIFFNQTKIPNLD